MAREEARKGYIPAINTQSPFDILVLALLQIRDEF
jgi:hypothetical protein